MVSHERHAIINMTNVSSPIYKIWIISYKSIGYLTSLGIGSPRIGFLFLLYTPVYHISPYSTQILFFPSKFPLYFFPFLSLFLTSFNQQPLISASWFQQLDIKKKNLLWLPKTLIKPYLWNTDVSNPQQLSHDFWNFMQQPLHDFLLKSEFNSYPSSYSTHTWQTHLRLLACKILYSEFQLVVNEMSKCKGF